MEILRARNVGTTIYFSVTKVSVQDFAQGGDWTPVAADTKFSKDGAAFANTDAVPTHEGQGIWSLALTASEVDGKITAISIIDAATKAIEDQAILIATYGDSSSSIEAFPVDVLEIADAILNRDMDQVEGTAPVHSLTVAILKAVSRIKDNSGVLQTYKTDGVSIIAQQTLTVAATSPPVTEAAVATA